MPFPSFDSRRRGAGGGVFRNVRQLLVGTAADLGGGESFQVNGGAKFNGTVGLSALTCSGAATIGGTLGVTGAATIGGALSAASSAISGNETVGGTLVVTGNATLSATAAVHTSPGGNQGSATFAVLSGNAGAPAIEAYNNASTGEAFRARVDNTNSPLLNLFFSTNQVGSISTTTTNAAFNTSSDERLKTKLERQRDFLTMIREMWIGDVEYNAAPGDAVLAVMAQQIAPIYPDAVTYPAAGAVRLTDESGEPVTDESGDPVMRAMTEEEVQQLHWQAEYGRLGILALKGCQMLLQIIDAQQDRLAALEAKVG